MDDVSYNICRNMVISGCKWATQDQRTEQPTCIECKDGFIRTASGCPELQPFPRNVDVNTFEMTLEEMGHSYVGIQCVAEPSNVTFHPTQTGNCNFFEVVGSEAFCKQCNFGTTGEIDTFNGVNYVNCNQTVPNCATDSYYGGGHFDAHADNFYGSTIAHMFTCHHCENAGEIPFVHLAFNGSLVPYGLEAGNTIPS
ncbi:MAG: hypothetical protein GY938_03050 [Ketobacter sp.]|nr:hypothetical protein [Ketobacter sp.]